MSTLPSTYHPGNHHHKQPPCLSASNDRPKKDTQGNGEDSYCHAQQWRSSQSVLACFKRCYRTVAYSIKRNGTPPPLRPLNGSFQWFKVLEVCCVQFVSVDAGGQKKNVLGGYSLCVGLCLENQFSEGIVCDFRSELYKIVGTLTKAICLREHYMAWFIALEVASFVLAASKFQSE